MTSLMIAAGSICALAALSTAREAPGGYFKNEAWGYMVRVPRGWRQAALSSTEEWIASKHLGKRKLEAVKSEYWSREEPEMWVIGFPHIRAEREGEGDFTNPYASYRDFAERHEGFLDWESGGYSIAKKGETKVDGVQVTKYAIEARERRKHAPRRVVTWVYHFDDIDFAVQFKILDEHYSDYEASFRGCLKSFRRIERKKAIPGTRSTGTTPEETLVDLDRLSPGERRLALKDAVERKFQREIEALPEGWRHRRSKHFRVITNADEEFVRETIQHAEAVRAHIEKLFGDLGSKFVPPGILRIFATEGEREAFQQGTDEDEGLVKEVLVVFGHGWVRDNEYESLNQAIFSQWLHYKDRHLEPMMPRWLKEGLDKYMGMLRSRGRRIRFSNEDWDRDWTRMAIRDGKYLPLIQLIGEEYGCVDSGEELKMLESYDKDRQARGVVFWLMRDGNRGRYRGFVGDYFNALALTLEEAEEEVRKELDERRKAAEEAERRIRREPDSTVADPDHEVKPIVTLREKREEILKKAHERVFGKWTKRDWVRFTRAWVEHAK